MKVLFYVEPHFIRNNKNAFHHVANQFIPLLKTNPKDGYSAKIFVNSYIFSSIKPEIKNLILDKFIHPTEDEEIIFSSSFGQDENQQTKIWLDLIGGIGISDQYQIVLRRLYREFPFDVIVHWGENGAIRKFSNEYHVTNIGIELGCTRKPFFESLAIDIFGTNGSALIPKLSISQIKTAVNKKTMSRFEALMSHDENISSASYLSMFKPLNYPQLPSLLSSKKTVFLPLQLYDDINLIHFSPYKKLTDVVLDIVPKLASKGFTTIIKTHPLSSQRTNGLLENAIARNSIKKWSDKVIWIDEELNSNINSQIIQHSSFTITVNSSVGFEATFFDKPVVILGDAVYKPKDLFPTLQAVLNNTFNPIEYQENLGYLREFMLGAYLQPNSILENKLQFINLVKLLVYAKNDGFGKPSNVASILYSSINPIRSLALKLPEIKNFSDSKTPNKIYPTFTAANTNNYKAIKESILKLLIISKANNFQEFENWFLKKIATKDGFSEIIHISKIVNQKYYLNKYPDVIGSAISPTIHYSDHGIYEGRSPQDSIIFNSKDDFIETIITTARSIFYGKYNQYTKV